MDKQKLIIDIQSIAKQAGDAIMEIYQDTDIAFVDKDDRSPLTAADTAAHNIIFSALQELTPDIPILSEESKSITYEERKDWTTFWLVDPLDGTKEFIKKNGEFTVNIALIENCEPTLGIVHAPALNLTYGGLVNQSAWLEDKGKRDDIKVYEKQDSDPLKIVASRSHRSEELESFIKRCGNVQCKSVGSSLKICHVADGSADIYPRIGLTSEWDTAAAHAVLLAAGGSIVKSDGHSLEYNKENILNPHFMAMGAIDPSTLPNWE